MRDKIVPWEKLKPGKRVYDGYRKIEVCGIFGQYAICKIADFPMCPYPFVIHNDSKLRLYKRRPKNLSPDDAFTTAYHFGKAFRGDAS